MSESTSVDVLIVGAGISGIDVAYRIRQRCPELHVLIVDARDRPGGTWDLFRYPGVRSDSDFFTLAFPFHPWGGQNSIVSGAEILQYLDDVIDTHGIREQIRFGTRVNSADWSSEHSRWRVTCEGADGAHVISARFVVSCTGYYDPAHPYDAALPGLQQFAGRVLHPQSWPEDFDPADATVAVIGSGATAVSILPALAAAGAKHVTMVQRTPSYVLAQPRTDPVANLLRRLLPAMVAHRTVRAKNAGLQWALYRAFRTAPVAARALLRRGVIAGVGSPEIADRDFNPPYAPWDQRLCIAPQGDLFEAVRNGSCSVVTGTIESIVPQGIQMDGGQLVEADVIVTATGLSVQILGGIAFSVDAVPVDASSRFVYRGTLLSDVPNLAFCVGYVNMSWTMRADLTARLIARILRRLLDTGADQVIAHPDHDHGAGRPIMSLQSGYLRRAAARMPRVGEQYPWTMEQDYLKDAWQTNRADIVGELTWHHTSQHHQAIPTDGTG